MFGKILFILLCLISLLVGCDKATIDFGDNNLSSQSGNRASSMVASESSEENNVSQTNSEVSESETEAQYFPIEGTETKDIRNARFDFWLTMPSDWKAFDRSENGDGYFIECENKNIDIRVYGMNDVLPEDFYINSDNGGTVSEFVFDNEISGWQIEKTNSNMEFLYKTNGSYIVFYVNYENNPAWFKDNKEEIFLTAKTLRNGKHIE